MKTSIVSYIHPFHRRHSGVWAGNLFSLFGSMPCGCDSHFPFVFWWALYIPVCSRDSGGRDGSCEVQLTSVLYSREHPFVLRRPCVLHIVSMREAVPFDVMFRRLEC
jgi:hypothetical protein